MVKLPIVLFHYFFYPVVGNNVNKKITDRKGNGKFWPKSDTGRKGKGTFWPKMVTPINS